MFGGLSKLITGASNNVNSAKSIAKSAMKGLKRAEELGEQLGILDSEGAYRLQSAPEVLSIEGVDTSSHAWFSIVSYPESSGGSGSSVKGNKTSGNDLSDSSNVKVEQTRLKRTDAMLKLPYPQALQVSDNFQWSGEERGMLGNLGALDQVSLEQAGNAGGEAVKAGLKALAGSTLSNEYSFRNKEISNPHLSAMFKGVDLRQVAFSFELVPRSRDDVKSIIKTINLIKKHAHPDAESTFGDEKNAIPNRMKYPDEFAIRVIKGDYTYISMDHCVVTNINTNYTPQGLLASYDDGFPIAVQLDISFMETVARTRKNFDTINSN